MEHKKRHKLILSPALSQSLACARILKHSPKEYKLTGGWFSDENQFHIPDLYDDFIIVEENDKPDRLTDYNGIIPTGSKGTKWMLSHRDTIKLGSQVMSSDVLVVFDKIKSLKVASEQGVSVPKTWSSYEKAKAHNGPVFYKPCVEGTGGKRGSIKSSRTLPEPVKLNLNEYIFQEKIESRGTYGVGFLAEDGQLTLSTSHFEMYSYPRDGGSAAIIRPYSHERLLELTKRFLSKLEYTGWGLAEFKWCPRREDFVFMEINAKLWASIELAFQIEPDWAKKLFDIDLDPRSPKGLIWLDRLLGSGMYQTASTLPYILYYDFVWDAPFFRRLFSKVSPNGIKQIMKWMMNR